VKEPHGTAGTDVIMPDQKDLPENAKALLAKLQKGPNVAVPSVYVHCLAFSDHAQLYLDNAVSMCRQDGADDFRVFGVLYCLRHGLELWLKCLLRNRQIDLFLAEAFNEPGLDFEGLMSSLGFKRKEKRPFQRALCTMRNVLVDGISLPDQDPTRVRQEVRWANKGLDHLRATPELQRDRFAMLCPVRLPTHSLESAWEATADLVESFSDAGRGIGQQLDVQARVSSSEFEALVALLQHYDPNGDAFRYPVSLDGNWHGDLPPLSLDALRDLAERARDTVLFFQVVRHVAYERATVSKASPFLHLSG
jgi:hypothetical protein